MPLVLGPRSYSPRAYIATAGTGNRANPPGMLKRGSGGQIYAEALLWHRSSALIVGTLWPTSSLARPLLRSAMARVSAGMEVSLSRHRLWTAMGNRPPPLFRAPGGLEDWVSIGPPTLRSGIRSRK